MISYRSYLKKLRSITSTPLLFTGLLITAMFLGACSRQPATLASPTGASSVDEVQSPVAPPSTLTPSPSPELATAPAAPSPQVQRPTATATPSSEVVEQDGGSTPVPDRDLSSLPPPTLFDISWDDRSPFRGGLIESEQAVLKQLLGASVYHIDLQIEDDLTHLRGREEVRYTNQENEPLNELYFRLFPNLASGLTEVASVKVNDQTIEPRFELRNSALRVPLPAALQPAEQVVIQIEFSVEVPSEQGGNYGTFAFLDDVLALAHIYPMIPVYDDEGWNLEIAPNIGDVVYSDTSFYLVRVSAPADQTIAGSGIEIEREQADGRQIITIAAGPVRDFYLAVSDRYTVTSRTVGQTTLNSYAPNEQKAGADTTLAYAADSLQRFNERFGPYPFTEFDLVSTTTSALGVEYPGIVAILIDIYDRSQWPLLEGVVAHEVAHQWFYSTVGNDQIDEPWIDEALAQYATLLYYSDIYGPSGASGFRGSLERRWERVDQADIPIGLPVRDYAPREYGAIVYGRGPLFIESLAETIGQEQFAAFLRDYYQTHQWGIATGESFKQLAEQHCKCDLTPLFEASVYGDPTTGR